MKKIMVLAVAAIAINNVFAFDGVVGETLKGVGYVLFGDNIQRRCYVDHHTTVMVGNTPYVTDLYRSGYNNYYYRPKLVVRVPDPQPVQQVVVEQVTTPTYYTEQTVVTAPTDKVSVTQVANPTRVWVPTRYETRTTAEGLTIRVKIPGHYVMTY